MTDPQSRTGPESATPPTGTAALGRLLWAMIAIVLFTYTGQFLLNASIAPLSRELGLREWHIGATVSLAALMVAVLSQRWGRAGMSIGRRRVLLSALVLALAAGLLFALTTWARMAGYLGVTATVAGIVASRGALFGAAVAAVPATCNSLIAEVTPTVRERVKAMASFSASFNIAALTGALASAVLGAWWLLAPVYATPVCVTIALIIALVTLPRTGMGRQVKNPPKLRVRDGRIFAYLATSFAVFFGIGVIQLVIGFVFADRYALSPRNVIIATGAAMMAQAVGQILAQLVIVRLIVWAPPKFIRVGITVQVFATLLIALPLPLWAVFAGTFLIGIGVGMSAPNFNAGASLAVQADELGAISGLLSATGGTSWIFAPIVGTTLYGIAPGLALSLAVSAPVLAAIFAYTHPVIRHVKRR